MSTSYKDSTLLKKTSKIVLLLVCTIVLVGCGTINSFAVSDEDKPVCLDNSEECKKLNRRYHADKAAGNIGDWYDNRDGGHSGLNAKRYPQVSVVTYTENEKV